jgi:hypothetical protein
MDNCWSFWRRCPWIAFWAVKWSFEYQNAAVSVWMVVLIHSQGVNYCLTAALKRKFSSHGSSVQLFLVYCAFLSWPLSCKLYIWWRVAELWVVP